MIMIMLFPDSESDDEDVQDDQQYVVSGKAVLYFYFIFVTWMYC